jgi:hypothetical protein
MHARFPILIAVIAAALTLPAGASAAAKDKSTNVDASIAGVGCGITGTACGGDCCVTFWAFAGRAIIGPGLGSFRFTGNYDEGFDPFSDPAAPIGLRDLTLTLVAGNGDQLVLDEHTTWPLGEPVPPPTWNLDPELSTGRFAAYTGSGVYGIEIGTSADGTYATFTLDLTGTLTASR